MEQLGLKWIVQFASQPRNVNVNDVVERCVSSAFLPDLPCDHFSRDYAPLIPHEVFEQLELAGGEIQRLLTARSRPLRHVHFEIGDLHPGWCFEASST